MRAVLFIIGLLGVVAAVYLFFVAAAGGGLAIAIMLPACFIGALIAFALLGLSELLHVAYNIESIMRKAKS